MVSTAPRWSRGQWQWWAVSSTQQGPTWSRTGHDTPVLAQMATNVMQGKAACCVYQLSSPNIVSGPLPCLRSMTAMVSTLCARDTCQRVTCPCLCPATLSTTDLSLSRATLPTLATPSTMGTPCHITQVTETHQYLR